MKPLKLGTLKNLSTHQIEEIDLDVHSEKIRPFFEGHKKEIFRNWCNNTHTNWIFYSGFLGLNPHERVSRNNPAQRMSALVVDYDAYNQSDSSIDEALNGHSKNRGIAPNYVSRTFSNGIRAVWVFEEPVQVLTNEVAEIFVSKLNDFLRCRFLFPGLDERALKNISQYYEYGEKWIEYEDVECINSETLHRLLAEAVAKANVYHIAEKRFLKIPLDIVYDEICKRYPDRWKGSFEVGSRGVRFWDPYANAMSAIVKEDGMVCFTGESRFMSWSDILGRDFVDKFSDETIGKITKNIFFEGRKYYIFDENQKRYLDFEEKALRWKFENDFYICSTKEQNTILHQIVQKNRVDYVAPIVHKPIGIMELNGRRLLNTWVNKTTQMTESSLTIDPKESFKTLHYLWFENGFNPPEQLDFLLAWIKRAYISAINLKPTRGQVLVIAGPPNSGKSLTAEILNLIFGGCSDASRYLKGESTFNGHLFETCIWIVDDTIIAGDDKARTAYSSNLKKIAADNRFDFSEKYQKGGTIEWNGRVIVTCNEDEISLSAVPDIFQSNDDKVILLRISDNSKKFTEINILEEIKKELPYFLRWLVHQWTAPSHVIGSSRFGVAPYKNESIWSASVESHDNYKLEEILNIFLTNYFKHNPSNESAQWTVVELLEAMQDEYSPVRSSTKNLNTKGLGKELKKLAISNTFKGVLRKINGRKFWRFQKQDFTEITPENENIL